MNYQPEDDIDRETPFGGLDSDSVTPKEYKRAIETLREVLSINPEEVMTLEDLSARVSLVGEELRRVVLASGHIQTLRFAYTKPGDTKKTEAIDRTWVIRKPVGDHTIFAASKTNNSQIEAYTINEQQEQLSEFNVRLPNNSDIISTNDGLMNMFNIAAIDWRSGEAQSFYPARDPFNSDVQQGFLRVLQDGVRDILSVINKPEE